MALQGGPSSGTQDVPFSMPFPTQPINDAAHDAKLATTPRLFPPWRGAAHLQRMADQGRHETLKHQVCCSIDADDRDVAKPPNTSRQSWRSMKRWSDDTSPDRINLGRTGVKAVSDQAAAEGDVCSRLMTSLRGTPWPDPGLPPEWWNLPI